MTEHDRREFYKYALFVVVTSIGVGHMFYTMWLNGTWRYASDAATAVSWYPDGTTGVMAALLFGLGIHLGFLLVFMQNRRKYYQGVLLLVGTVTAVGVLGLLGLGSDFEVSLLNAFALGTGLSVVALAEMINAKVHIPVVARSDGSDHLADINDDSIPIELRYHELELEGRLHQIDPEKSSWGDFVDLEGNRLSFPVATYGLLSFIILLVSVSNVLNFLIVHPNIQGIQFLHLGISGLFLWFLSSFVRLNPSASSSLQVLGPTQSGKTYFVLASALAVERNDRFKMTKAEGWINRLLEDHKEWARRNRTRDDRSVKWDIDDTGRDRLYYTDFTVTTNDRIPKALHFNVVDHAGEFLEKVANRVAPPMTDGGEDVDDSAEESEYVAYVCDECDHVETSNEAREGDICEDCKRGYIQGTNELIDQDGDDGADDPSNIQNDPGTNDVEEGDVGNDLHDEAGDWAPVEEDATTHGSVDEEDSSEGGGTDDTAIGTASDTFDTPESTGDATETETTSSEVDAEQVDPESEVDEDVDETEAEETDDERGTLGDLLGRDDDEGDETGHGDDQETDHEPSDSRSLGTDANVLGSSDGLDELEVLDELVPRVEESDMLLLMLDCVRLEGGAPAGTGSERLQTSEMNRIVNGVDPDRVILVASKADVLIDEWKRWHARKNSDSVGAERLPDPHEVEKYRRSFRDYVTERFEQRASTLLSNADSGFVYPVYFETERAESDKGEEWMPNPDENGELVPHGYEHVLSVIAQEG